MENKFIMSSSPHLHTSTTITKIMLDVIIALAPAAVLGVFFFGFYAALVIAVAVASAVVSEWVFDKITKKRNTTPASIAAFAIVACTGMALPKTVSSPSKRPSITTWPSSWMFI